MTQVLPRYCPRCGVPLVTNSDICTECGLPLEGLLSSEQHTPTEQGFDAPEHVAEIDEDATRYNPDQQEDNQLDKVPTVELSQQSVSLSGVQSSTTTYKQAFPSTPIQNKRKMGRRELVVILVLLLLVLAAVMYAIFEIALPGFFNTQSPITTTSINISVPYAGVDITILNVQQSQSFLNDPTTNSDGMVRLNLQEQNQTDIKVAWSYASIARLALPKKSFVSPTYVNSIVSVAPGKSQKSVIDFAVPTNVSLNQITFVLGGANEAQMLIPLERNANASLYQPKTTNVHGEMVYFGLNWTLTSATSSLSIQGAQASKAMRYLTLQLKVDNPLSQIAIAGSPYDYMRLQYGSTSVKPSYSSMPVAFQAGASGVVGSVSFQAPQNTHAFTFMLIPQRGDSGDQSSTDFHVP